MVTSTVSNGSNRWGTRLFALLLLGLFAATAQAQKQTCTPAACPTSAVNTITIDGSACDWQGIFHSGSTVQVKSLKRDANKTGDSQFTEGSHDRQQLSEWVWNEGSTNNKGDISTTAAALIGNILYFCGDRVSTSGSAQIGFWFFQDEVNLVNGKFTGEKKVGDLLILSHFTEGGGTPEIAVFEWVGTGGSHIQMDDITDNILATTATAKVNSTCISVPNATQGTDTWGYAGGNTYPTGAFFEGSLNLTDIFGTGNIPCFSTFLLETRNAPSVSSIQASLQDLASDDFNVTPEKFALTGSSFCDDVATTGSLTLAGSELGVNYQLYNSSDATVQAVKPGTGSELIWTGVAPGTGYYVRATRVGYNCSTDSDPANVVSNPAPVVNVDNEANCAGASVTFEATPNNTTTYSYQWYRNNGIINGATSPSYVVSNITASMHNDEYKCVVTNKTTLCDGDEYGTLTVNPNPAPPDYTMVNPTCSTAKGYISVKDPVAGYKYSYNDGTFGTSTGPFPFDAGAGWKLEAQNTAGCISNPATCTADPDPSNVTTQGELTPEGSTNIDARIISKGLTRVLAAPNPFTDKVRFTLQSDVSGQGSLEIFNTMGQKIATVYQGHVEAGRVLNKEYNVERSLRANLIYVFRVGDQKTTGKLLNW